MEGAEDEYDDFAGAYDDGKWIWNENLGGLEFVRNIRNAPSTTTIRKDTVKVPTGAFKDDVDLLQQVKFQKVYMRRIKPDEPNIITLQDVKDLAIFTAPTSLLSPMLINLLHKPTTERFLRALILYCQYFLQVEDKMNKRLAELQRKIRTAESDVVEEEFKDNLSDLRTLVAQQYSIIVIGAAETKRFHHMGASKKMRSLTKKDARLFETLLRIAIQIVWLALTRRTYDKIEIEVNRIFKSDYFNSVEHTRKTEYVKEMPKRNAEILLGDCLKDGGKLRSCSPLMNEVHTSRPIDYRLLGLGVINYERLSARLTYFLMAIASPEQDLVDANVTVGILGLPRSSFDTMLNVLPTVLNADGDDKISSKSIAGEGLRSKSSKACSSVSQKTDKASQKCIYGEVMLPAKCGPEPSLPDEFPEKSMPPLPCDEVQRLKWQTRLLKRNNRESKFSTFQPSAL